MSAILGKGVVKCLAEKETLSLENRHTHLSKGGHDQAHLEGSRKIPLISREDHSTVVSSGRTRQFGGICGKNSQWPLWLYRRKDAGELRSKEVYNFPSIF